MSDFAQAVAVTLHNEGGYSNSPNDSGGETKYGITQADMPGADIAMLSVIEATDYYREHYWKPLYSQIGSQMVAGKLFDLGVLFGIGTVVKVIQSLLPVVVDGVFGPQTLAEVNAADAGPLLSHFKSAMQAHAHDVVMRNPKDGVFLQGWLNRIGS